jgi:hypothetical protein
LSKRERRSECDANEQDEEDDPGMHQSRSYRTRGQKQEGRRLPGAR